MLTGDDLRNRDFGPIQLGNHSTLIESGRPQLVHHAETSSSFWFIVEERFRIDFTLFSIPLQAHDKRDEELLSKRDDVFEKTSDQLEIQRMKSESKTTVCYFTSRRHTVDL